MGGTGNGKFYGAAVAAMPLPTLSAWEPWFQSLLANRIAYCPLVQNATYFFSNSTSGASIGSDSHDGLDGIGLALSAGSYTASTQTLTGSSSATFVWYPGALVYLKSGVTAGLYKLASGSISGGTFTGTLAVSADTTIEGSLAAPLSNNSGAVTSSNGPYQTLAKGAAIIAALPSPYLAMNLRFRLNRGSPPWYADQANNSTQWSIQGNYFTLDSYGVGSDPVLSYYRSTALTSAGWSVFSSAYPNVWTRSAPTATAWSGATNYVPNNWVTGSDSVTYSAKLPSLNKTPASGANPTYWAALVGTGVSWIRERNNPIRGYMCLANQYQQVVTYTPSGTPVATDTVTVKLTNLNATTHAVGPVTVGGITQAAAISAMVAAWNADPVAAAYATASGSSTFILTSTTATNSAGNTTVFSMLMSNAALAITLGGGNTGTLSFSAGVSTAPVTDAANLLACQNTPYSFCLTSTGTVLNVNPGYANISGQNFPVNAAFGNNLFEYNVQQAVNYPAISVQFADSVRIQDISVDGWGQLTPSSGISNQSNYSIYLAPSALLNFTVSGITTWPTPGALYSSTNGMQYTVVLSPTTGTSGTISTNLTDLPGSTTPPYAGSTLTKVSGTGDSSITFSACAFGAPCEVLGVGLKALYSGYHGIGLNLGYGFTGSSGVATLVNSTAGYATEEGAGDYPIICFDGIGDGGNSEGEFIVYECEIPYGALPNDTASSGESAQTAHNLRESGQPGSGSGSFYGHVISGTVGLYIRGNCTIGNGRPNSPNSIGGGPPTPTAATLAAVRSFIFGERCLGFQPMNNLFLTNANGVVFNSIYEFSSIPGSNGTVVLGGWGWNNVIRENNQFQTGGGKPSDGYYNTVSQSGMLGSSSSEATTALWNCTLEILEGRGIDQIGVSDGGNVQSSLTATNCIFKTHNNSGYTNYLGIPNNSTSLVSNAYCGPWLVGGAGPATSSSGFNADTTGLVLAGVATTHPPTADSPLIGAGSSAPGLQYDLNWNFRPAVPSIGPFEAITPTSGWVIPLADTVEAGVSFGPDSNGATTGTLSNGANMTTVPFSFTPTVSTDATTTADIVTQNNSGTMTATIAAPGNGTLSWQLIGRNQSGDTGVVLRTDASTPQAEILESTSTANSPISPSAEIIYNFKGLPPMPLYAFKLTGGNASGETALVFGST